MPTVSVLMSTYNGHKYIRKQLDSLLLQEGVDVHIIVRDDGSKDETPQILSEYADKHSNIESLSELNCGAEESFNKLCKFADKHGTSEYYAFCDQDDIWDTDKLKVAIDKLDQFETSTPNLYFSNLKMVDENLNYMRDFYVDGDVFMGKNKSLVQIFTYGCTCVFNRKALEMYCAVEKNKTFHDNWIYVICSYIGNVVYDPVGHIQYRQHSNNLSGHRETGMGLFLSRLVRPFKGNLGHDFESLARQLLIFSDLIKAEDLKLIKRVAYYRESLAHRMALLFSTNYCTGRIVKDVCIKYRIIINRL